MGRFLVVVIVLVAIALLANKYLLGEGDVPPPAMRKPPGGGCQGGSRR